MFDTLQSGAPRARTRVAANALSIAPPAVNLAVAGDANNVQADPSLTDPAGAARVR